MSTDTRADEVSSSTTSNFPQQSPFATDLQDPAAMLDVPVPDAQTPIFHEEINTTTNDDSSRCYIMGLPKEPRLMIYELVFQDILNEISAPHYPLRPGEYDVRKPAMRDSLRRVLALVYTSHAFHSESRRIGRKLVSARKAYVKDGFNGDWYRQRGEVGHRVIRATMDAKRRLRELSSMKKLMHNRRW
jgi:hypothetical protein